jgi:hypothetical protein
MRCEKKETIFFAEVTAPRCVEILAGTHQAGRISQPKCVSRSSAACSPWGMSCESMSCDNRFGKRPAAWEVRRARAELASEPIAIVNRNGKGKGEHLRLGHKPQRLQEGKRERPAKPWFARLLAACPGGKKEQFHAGFFLNRVFARAISLNRERK